MNKLDELEKKYQELGAEIEKLKAEKDVDEWPKPGVMYYYVMADGSVNGSVWDDKGYQMHHLASGNVHRTKEEAEDYKAWLTSPRTQARREVEMCEGFSPKGEVFIYTRGTDLIIRKAIKYDGGIQFDSKEQAQACIDKLGDEKIKVALGVIGNL